MEWYYAGVNLLAWIESIAANGLFFWRRRVKYNIKFPPMRLSGNKVILISNYHRFEAMREHNAAESGNA